PPALSGLQRCWLASTTAPRPPLVRRPPTPRVFACATMPSRSPSGEDTVVGGRPGAPVLPSVGGLLGGSATVRGSGRAGPLRLRGVAAGWPRHSLAGNGAAAAAARVQPATPLLPARGAVRSAGKSSAGQSAGLG